MVLSIAEKNKSADIDGNDAIATDAHHFFALQYLQKANLGIGGDIAGFIHKDRSGVRIDKTRSRRLRESPAHSLETSDGRRKGPALQPADTNPARQTTDIGNIQAARQLEKHFSAY